MIGIIVMNICFWTMGFCQGVVTSQNDVVKNNTAIVERAPAEEAIVYEGNNPPSDTSRLWHDTSNPDSGFGYTTMIYRNGKWTPLYPHITTVKDYK